MSSIKHIDFREIIVNTTTYAYFKIFLIDGKTPATGLVGEQPQININNGGWETTDISVFEEIGFGLYQSLLSDSAVGAIGNKIFTHFSSPNTKDSYGQPIEIVKTLSVVPIFEDPCSPPTILTYLSLPDAENYFSTRLYSNSWYNSSQHDKISSLVMATRDINQLNFYGVKEKKDQKLEFPRYIGFVRSKNINWWGVETDFDLDHMNFDPSRNISHKRPKAIFPDEVKFACCEIAYNYLDGVDIEAEINKMNIESQGYANVRQSYNRVSVNEAKRAGINSNKAWIYLKPYLNDPNEVQLIKV